ncbi:hypothetical protein Q3G72_028488 [Acer saccharum]|nr:hypothetical protein Q3G72_028488 [Acer saccharum]
MRNWSDGPTSDLRMEVSGVNGWREEEDWEIVGGKVGLTNLAAAAAVSEAQENIGGCFKYGQNKRGKVVDRRERETDQPIPDATEERSGFHNISRRNNHGKGKKIRTPISRKSVQRKDCGKLIIREKQDLNGKGRESDNTSSLSKEGLFSEFLKWKGERGKCSRPVLQRKVKVATDIEQASCDSSHGP